jgi:hypothetical protein
MPSPSIDGNSVVRTALERAIRLGEFGVSVAAYYKGQALINEVAGLADKETGRFF